MVHRPLQSSPLKLHESHHGSSYLRLSEYPRIWRNPSPRYTDLRSLSTHLSGDGGVKNQVPMPVFEPATNRSEIIYYGSKGIAREVSTPLIKWYIDRYTQRAFTAAPTADWHLFRCDQAPRWLQQHLYDRAPGEPSRSNQSWEGTGRPFLFSLTTWALQTSANEPACPAEDASSHADSSGARLDRWLVSTNILHHVRHTDTIVGLPGDHLGVVITPSHSPTGQPRGPAPWTFPMQLLDDPVYRTELTDLVQQTLQQNPVCQSYSHGQRWDALKRDIRDHCTEYSHLARIRQTAETAVLRSRAAEARRAFTEASTAGSHLSVWQQAYRDLQQHHHDRAQAAAVRAGILWQDYGEQSTFYFYHLGRQRQVATTFTQIRDSNWETYYYGSKGIAREVSIPLIKWYIDRYTYSLDGPRSRVAAGQALAQHFSSASPHGLFTPQPTCQDAQQEMLGALDTFLSEEAAQACEGAQPITLDELQTSLATLSRGKQPGSDGLPTEFYQQLWDPLWGILLEVFLEAFHSGDGGSLTSSQVQGTITMLYKGKGSRADPASYRPITLLNTDVKLLAKALTDRWAAYLGTVVDSTQTAFLPGRWIADNVLAHLEEMEYLETAKEPGCIAFLDFSKAYDRLDRQWVLKCMQKLGFRASALRWVGLLYTQLTARVRFNGWHSPTFPVDTGLAQGSPLCPLLFVIAAQPLAAHLRLQTVSRVLQPISRPDGSAAPSCHQHADDTTLHLRTRQDLQTALQTSIQPFCSASGSSLNAGKSQAMMLGGDDFHSVNPGSGITFIQRVHSSRHMGIRLSVEPQTAALETYTAILGSDRQVASHWVSRQLTLIGRNHVAKQVLASKVTYHATFIPIPRSVAKELTTCLVRFVSGAGPTLRPSRAVFALPWEQGGMRLIQLPDIEAALQAKVISILFEPERLVWKDFAAIHLSRSRQWLLDHPHVGLRTVDIGYGVRVILGTRRTQDLGISSHRFRAYIRAYRRLAPHRQSLLDHPHVPPRTVDLLGCGVRMILGTRRTQDLGIRSLRFRAYIRAHRRLNPHRLVQPASLTRHSWLWSPSSTTSRSQRREGHSLPLVTFYWQHSWGWQMWGIYLLLHLGWGPLLSAGCSLPFLKTGGMGFRMSSTALTGFSSRTTQTWS